MDKQLKEIEIPFGAKDSELCGWEYTIPDGMEATIVDNKIVFKKKESEDERIRKALVHLISEQNVFFTAINGISIKDIISWLEKQGEQKSIIIDVDKMVDEFAHTEVKGYGKPAMIEVDACRKGVNDALRLSLNLEKQSGQKPTDEEMKTILRTEYEKGRADAIAEMQKPVNIDYISGIRKELLGIEDNAKNINGLTESQWVAIRAAHRLLGEYMAKEQNLAWSEEDENLFRCAIDAVREESMVRTDGCLDEEVGEMVTKWLKSLKERFTWKPSDEQMRELGVVATGKGFFSEEILSGLLEQLKKLKE